MLTTLREAHAALPFSRPVATDGNPCSALCCRALKHQRRYPQCPFARLRKVRIRIESFVALCNTEHRHHAIRLSIPWQRYRRRDMALPARRHAIHERAHAGLLERWSGKARNWCGADVIHMNPGRVGTLIKIPKFELERTNRVLQKCER